MRGLVMAVVAGLLVVGERAQAQEKPIPLRGRVIDAMGGAISGVLVFASDETSGKVSASAKAEPDGRFALQVPPRKHQVGIVSTLFRVFAFREEAPGEVTLVVSAQPLAVDAATTRTVMMGPSIAVGAAGTHPAEPTPASIPPSPAAIVSVDLVRGRVVDETGAPLQGVQMVAIDVAGKKMAVVVTETDGRYTLAVRQGTYHLSPVSPGLKVARSSKRRDAEVDFVMAIDAAPQTIQITEGHVLTFRVEDSIWPEYIPPPQVRAWLDYAYGISPDFYYTCPSLAHTTARGTRVDVYCPPSMLVYSKNLSKFWWLHVLRQPPNTARLGSYLAAPAPRAFNSRPPLPGSGPPSERDRSTDSNQR